MTIGDAVGLVASGVTGMIGTGPGTIIVTFAVGALGGIAVDSKWAYNRGYLARQQEERQAINDRAAREFDQMYDAERRKAQEDAAARKAREFDRTKIPHGVEGHDCTTKCFFNSGRASPWDQGS